MSRWQEARNILAVRMDNLGDIVMLGPALRAIKRASPDSRMTLLGNRSGVAAASIVPGIDDTIAYAPLWQHLGDGSSFKPADDLALIELLAERRFDAALIFTSFSQTPLVPAYVCYLAGIPLRAGESKEFGGAVLTDPVPTTPIEIHQVDRNLHLVEAVGFTPVGSELEISIPDRARDAATALLNERGIGNHPFVLVHPGASAPARRYAPERFGAIARMLAEREAVLVTGTEREAEILAIVRREAPGVPVVAGETDLASYAALVERAALVICNDTLPMHLADAVGTPAVVLFSGTDYESQWEPRNVPCRLLRRPTPCAPCFYITCPIGTPCLDIDPAQVVAVAEELLTENLSRVDRVPEAGLAPEGPVPILTRHYAGGTSGIADRPGADSV
ncbi:MAG TPA: glycosyltransferase family 9 protein [Chloroflexota bacterium]|nr:glycosyltransferase family 9 protein [Chloroflexota bacterium]